MDVLIPREEETRRAAAAATPGGARGEDRVFCPPTVLGSKCTIEVNQVRPDAVEHQAS
jgi:hypothetical protein